MQSAPIIDGSKAINTRTNSHAKVHNRTHRLLVIFPNIAPGGTERVVQTLLPEFAKRYEVHCIMLADPENSPFQKFS